MTTCQNSNDRPLLLPTTGVPALDGRSRDRRISRRRIGQRRASDRRARDQLSSVLAVISALSGPLTRDQVAHIIVHQGIAAVGAGAGSVALLSSGGGDLEL